MPGTSHFFRELPGFRNFASQAFDNTYYRTLPPDWYLIITDIVSSTQAVEHGRYQDVNYVGAACIAALKNSLPHVSIPTVFGGDGATAAVPATELDSAISALTATRHWAHKAFKLELRIGAVPMSEIIAQGETVEVGKLELSQGNELAMFRGNGMELAENLIKNDDENNPFRRTSKSGPGSTPDLSSLSCRWSPLAAEHDIVLCVLIDALEHGRNDSGRRDNIYREALDGINDIVNIDGPGVSPVKADNLKFTLRFENLAKEIKSVRGSWFNKLKQVIGINLVAAFAFRFGRRVGNFDPHIYQQQILVNSDYKRINGTIQLVLDCTREQSKAIESLLEALFNQDKIIYGLSLSDSALMTCITPDIPNGVHVHYIDGSNGGFWRAAKDLKTRRVVVKNHEPGE